MLILLRRDGIYYMPERVVVRKHEKLNMQIIVFLLLVIIIIIKIIVLNLIGIIVLKSLMLLRVKKYKGWKMKKLWLKQEPYC